MDQVTRKPIVALVAHTIVNLGGMERACWELVRRGHDRFSFIAVTADLAPELRPIVKGWIRIHIPSRPAALRFAVFYLSASRAIRRVEADLVHSVGAIVPNAVDLSTVHFCHADYGQIFRSNGRVSSVSEMMHRLNRALAHGIALGAEKRSFRQGRLRALASVSEGLAGALRRYYDGLPVHITPCGVDTNRFRPDPTVRTRVRTELNLGPEVIALFVGGDWERKGLDLAIKALALAIPQTECLELWVVGDGDRRSFEALASAEGVISRVRFWGRHSDTERFYQAADLFIFPSSYEAFSLAILEAAASELPILVPSIHGAKEIVGNNEGGIVVQRDPTDISAALVKLACNVDLRKKLGQEARKRASPFTWERSAETTLSLYTSLLTGPTSSARQPGRSRKKSGRRGIRDLAMGRAPRNGNEWPIQRLFQEARVRWMPDRTVFLPVLTGIARGARVPVNFTKGIRPWLGIEELEIARYIRRLVIPGAVSLDVGAFFGYYSLALTRLGSRHVYAFEPDESRFQLLIETLKRNMPEAKNITPLNQSVGCRRPALSIDQFVEGGNRGNPQFIKIDVDGSELEVLLGAATALSSWHPRLVVEIHSADIEKACLEMLGEFDYLHKIVDQQTIWPEYRPIDVNRWIIAVHRKDQVAALLE